MELEKLKSYLDQTWSLLAQHEATSNQCPILRSNDPAEIKHAIAAELPNTGEAFDKVLAAFESQILPHLNRNTDTRYAAYITGSGNKISALAEFIKAFYNQNGLKWNNSPIASELEQLVLKWIAEFVHLPDFDKGVITSGGSMSNLMAMHFALASKFPDREMEGFYGTKPLTVYCSDQTHSSVDRAMVFLGLGRTYLRKIATNDQLEIRVDELRKQLEKDIESGYLPLMVIGNAGTTNIGSIDDLKALGSIAQEFDLWYHVDGAYGLPARRLPELAGQFQGVELADSVIINPHKWMYVTFEASCVLVKEIPTAIHFSPDYLFTENPGLRWESSEHTIELSKEFRALKIWFTMKYYGAEKLTRFVEHDIQMIQELSNRLLDIPNVEVEPHHSLSILCFRWNDTTASDRRVEEINVEAIRRIESEGNVFVTGTKLRGNTYLRVYYGNPGRTAEDVDQMVSALARTFKQITDT